MHSKSSISTFLFLLASAVIVALGQPAWSPVLAVVAAAGGYALCWWGLLNIERRWYRFLVGTIWFGVIQLFQLGWLLSHPFSYIYAVHVILALLMGIQYGILALLVTRERITSWQGILVLPALWTVFEWTRLFFLAGLTFNPAGLALAATLSSIQAANLFGIYGLSFWLMMTNGCVLYALLQPEKKRVKYSLLALLIAAAPYLYGAVTLVLDGDNDIDNSVGHLSVVVVDTTFPPEELNITTLPEMIEVAEQEWKVILRALGAMPESPEKIDLIIFPEGAVPLGAKHPFYDHEQVKNGVRAVFGEQRLDALPSLKEPLAHRIQTTMGPRWLVTNGYWVHTIAALFDADVLVGLEGEQVVKGKLRDTNGALFYHAGDVAGRWGYSNQYAKRVLLPMAEEIPYEWLKPLAAKYGIGDSFVRGEGPGVIVSGGVSLGLSVCYEETFSQLMRECRLEGAEMLINITNDVWYPRSKLGRQHYDLGRLRAVEQGIPLIRCCNYGISGAVDCRGRVLKLVDGNSRKEWAAEAVPIVVPRRQVATLYTLFGDGGVLFIVSLILFIALVRKNKDANSR